MILNKNSAVNSFYLHKNANRNNEIPHVMHDRLKIVSTVIQKTFIHVQSQPVYILIPSKASCQSLSKLK